MKTLLTLFVTAFSVAAIAQSDQSIRVEVRTSLESAKDYIDIPKAAIYSVVEARALMSKAQKNWGAPKAGSDKPAFDSSAKDFYCLVHIVTWKEVKAEEGKPKLEVKAQNWYTYHAGDWGKADFIDNRVYGSKNVWLMAVHLAAKVDFVARYEVDFKRLTPAPIRNLFELVSLLNPSALGEGTADTPDFFFVERLQVKHLPTEIAIQASAEPLKPGDTVGVLGDPKKYINEGRYRIDFGVANSITKLSQLKFESTNNTVTAAKASTTSAFGTVNLYPFPVDARNQGFSRYPYLVLGAGIARQPLHRMLFALGWGPKFAQFYVGAALVKGQTLASLSEGATATPAELEKAKGRAYSPQFSLGVSLPVRGFAALLKGDKK